MLSLQRAGWTGHSPDGLVNIRVLEERIGDVKAQVVPLTVGKRRLGELLDRYGRDTVAARRRFSFLIG